MANLVTTEAHAILNASSGQATYTNPVAPVQVALMITNGSASLPGTEVSPGGFTYFRQNISFSPAGSPTPGQITNSSPMTWPNMPPVTVVGVEEWDSAGTKVRRWFGQLQLNKTVNAGDTFSIAASSYTKSLS